MKYFLILVLFLFFAPALRAQVVIPDIVATWFLEKNQERIVLQKSIVTLREEISILKEEMRQDKVVEGTLNMDKQKLLDKVQLKEDELKHAGDQLKYLERQILGYKIRMWFAYGITILVIIISLAVHG